MGPGDEKMLLGETFIHIYIHLPDHNEKYVFLIVGHGPKGL